MYLHCVKSWAVTQKEYFTFFNSIFLASSKVILKPTVFFRKELYQLEGIWVIREVLGNGKGFPT